MGLTIHYNLKLDSDATSPPTARQLVERIRQRALDLPFEHVSELASFSGVTCDFRNDNRDDPWRWLKIQAGHYIAEPHPGGGELHHDVLPKRIFAFSTWPGEGSEPANFGLCQYPRTILVRTGRYRWKNGSYAEKLRRIETGHSGWSWRSFCKTQYASEPACGGLPNFLKCHLAVTSLLDFARTLEGLSVEVSDEGDYWERRDVEALAREVGNWNRMIAGFVGAISDVFGNEGRNVEAPIKKFPNFEHLEAAGQKEYLELLRQAADAVRKAADQSCGEPEED